MRLRVLVALWFSMLVVLVLALFMPHGPMRGTAALLWLCLLGWLVLITIAWPPKRR